MGKINTQKLMKYLRMAALAAPIVQGVANYGVSQAAAVTALRGYTGVNVQTGQFSMERLVEGWTPYLASVVATYGIPKLAGIIRSL